MDQSYPFFSPLKTRSDAKSWLLLRRIQDACESCLINWCHSFFFLHEYLYSEKLSIQVFMPNQYCLCFQKKKPSHWCQSLPNARFASLGVQSFLLYASVTSLSHSQKKKKVCIDPMVCIIVLEAVVNGIRNTVNTGTHPFTWAWQRYMICLMCWL